MVRMFFGLVLGVAACAFTVSTYAEDKKEEAKEISLAGKITCGKCDLKKVEKCAVVIVTKGKDGKETIYWFDKDAHAKYHDDVCTAAKEGSLKGTVKKDGEKMIITVKSLEYSKKK